MGKCTGAMEASIKDSGLEESNTETVYFFYLVKDWKKENLKIMC